MGCIQLRRQGLAAVIGGLGTVIFVWVAVASAQIPPPYTVTPVLFVPDPDSFPIGYRPTQEELDSDAADVTEAFQRLRAWFAETLGQPTSLDVYPTVLMEAYGGLSTYGITWVNPEARYTDGISVDGSFWMAVLTEVYSRGYGYGTAAYPRSVVILCKGAGGWAGANQWHNGVGGGMCILGDWCLDSLAERVPLEHWTWWTGKDRQTGAIGHELGHTLGLPHPDINNPVSQTQDWSYTLMGNWWNWPSFEANPADPDWPLRGLHGWGCYVGPPEAVPNYMDVFVKTYRAKWFATLLDEDGDGVLDSQDQCPGTPTGRTVDEVGCPIYAPSDFDGDGNVDTNDLTLFQACESGPAIDFASGCEAKDLDNDGDVDACDFGIFQRCLSGLETPIADCIE